MSEPPLVSYGHIPTQLIGTFLLPLSISTAALLKFNLMPLTDVYDFQIVTNKNCLGFSNSSNIHITNSLLQEIPPPPLGHVQQFLKDIPTDACSINFGGHSLPSGVLYVWSALAQVYKIHK